MNRLTWLLAAALLAATAACGSPARTGAEPDAELDVRVSLGEGRERDATLVCAGDAATGSGYLQDDAAARAACAAVLDDEKGNLLTDGSVADRVCTMVYGGPEKATVTGQIEGARVAATVERSNGCGIGDWDALVALLGRPGA